MEAEFYFSATLSFKKEKALIDVIMQYEEKVPNNVPKFYTISGKVKPVCNSLECGDAHSLPSLP